MDPNSKNKKKFDPSKQKQKSARYFRSTDDNQGDGANKQLKKKHSKGYERKGSVFKGKAGKGLKIFKKQHGHDDKPSKKNVHNDVEVFEINMEKVDHKFSRNIDRKRHGRKDVDTPKGRLRNEVDPFPGEQRVPANLIKKYQYGPEEIDTSTNDPEVTEKLKATEKRQKYAAKETARTELLKQDDTGFLRKTGKHEDTTKISQHDLANAVDITSARKFFELKLNDFGPYKINYTRNGRFLLLGGSKGHIAAIDWMTKKLLCEINVMETVQDVKWLHQETMYAVAQKQWSYIYDNQGVELHCLKKLDNVLRLEFLPYHFLLASANAKGYLSYIDVSVGEKVSGYGTSMGRLDVMCQNPANAIIALGHSGGTVTQWCPKVKDPVVKMLCHNSAVRAVAIEKCGHYMATSGIDRSLKIWDLRTYNMLHSYKLPAGAGQLSFSQRGLLAASMGNIVQMYEDCCTKAITKPYLMHDLHSSVNSLNFCPYEDVLGVGHSSGFSSLLVPGAGEPNFDALESNPYQQKKQRQEAEVKMLLDKIPADMIHLNANIVTEVYKMTPGERAEAKRKTQEFKKLNFEPKRKTKGRSKSGKLEQRKKGVNEEHRRDYIKETVARKRAEDRNQSFNEKRSLTTSVLDRFKKKDNS
ncbi:WD repeat-containing protein 46 [Mactra antiquata]